MLKDEKIKVLNLSESWLNPEIPNNTVRLDQYKIYRQERNANKRGGGLCTYVHKTLKVDALKYNELNVSNENIEAMVLEFQQKLTKPIILITEYRPPQGNQAEFTLKLREILINLKSHNDVMVIGDFNIDIVNQSTKSAKDLTSMADEFTIR